MASPPVPGVQLSVGRGREWVRPDSTVHVLATLHILEETIMKDALQRLRENIVSVYMGNARAVDRLMVCLLSRGHALIEDVPRVGRVIEPFITAFWAAKNVFDPRKINVNLESRDVVIKVGGEAQTLKVLVYTNPSEIKEGDEIISLKRESKLVDDKPDAKRDIMAWVCE